LEHDFVKLLYLSCHQVLEFDEIALFHELGIEVFSAGDYLRPGQTNGPLRPSLPQLPTNFDDLAAFNALTKPGCDPRDSLTRNFVDRFDAVLVMHVPRWIVHNWEAMRHKPVIWRTIGHSWPEIEFTMQSYRGDGLNIVRYSPAERRLPNYAGEDALIRFYKDPVEWGGWTGERPVFVCFSGAMPQRAEHCNFPAFRKVSDSLPCELFGIGNEAAGAVCRGCLTYDEMRAVLRSSRACFYTGTFPACYTLGFIEAWMTGIPVVAIGPRIYASPNAAVSDWYEIPQLIEHEINGFVSDDYNELRSCLKCLLAHWDYAREVSQAGRASAISHFDKAIVRDQWGRFFSGLPTHPH
jgi:hypothetical protein